MQFYTLSQTSLAKSGSSIVEEYIPLWMADGTGTFGNGITTAGSMALADGNGLVNMSTSSALRLYTLNPNWSSSQQFAFEATIYTSVSSVSCLAALWDFSLGTPAIISGSQISTLNTTATVLRSSKFTLTPGHVYGVTLWSGTTGASAYAIDASLIVFG